MYGLLRGTLALVGVVLFLPLVGLTTIILPAAALTKWLVSSNFAYSLCIFIVLFVIGLVISWVLAQTRYSDYTALVQSLLSIVALFFLVSVMMGSTSNHDLYSPKQTEKSVSWPYYHKLCYEPSWNGNVAQMQLKCSYLENVPVNWDGYVKEISITSVKNPRKYFIDKFPIALRNYLYCFYGEKIERNCNETKDITESDCHYFYDIVTSNNECTLEKFNRYEFNIIVTMRSSMWDKGHDINIQVGDYFKNFTFLLQPEDNIWFKGVLLNNFSSPSNNQANVRLVEIGCVQCSDEKLMRVTSASLEDVNLRSIINDIFVGLKSVLNFILNPVIVVK